MINYLLETGELPNSLFPSEESIKIRLKLKKIWFEHVKRRPNINYIMQPEREAAWERFKVIAGNPNLKKPPMFEPTYSQEEQRIIDTPLAQLMENFEKDLKNSI